MSLEKRKEKDGRNNRERIKEVKENTNEAVKEELCVTKLGMVEDELLGDLMVGVVKGFEKKTKAGCKGRKAKEILRVLALSLIEITELDGVDEESDEKFKKYKKRWKKKERRQIIKEKIDEFGEELKRRNKKNT